MRRNGNKNRIFTTKPLRCLFGRRIAAAKGDLVVKRVEEGCSSLGQRTWPWPSTKSPWSGARASFRRCRWTLLLLVQPINTGRLFVLLLFMGRLIWYVAFLCDFFTSDFSSSGCFIWYLLGLTIPSTQSYTFPSFSCINCSLFASSIQFLFPACRKRAYWWFWVLAVLFL